MAFLDNAGLEYLLSYITLSDSNLQHEIKTGIETLESSIMETLENSIPDVWPVDRGGTGANNGIDALLNLGIKMSGRTIYWDGNPSGYTTYSNGSFVRVSDLPSALNASSTLSDVQQYFNGLALGIHVDEGNEGTAIIGGEGGSFKEGRIDGIYTLGDGIALVCVFVKDVIYDGETIPPCICFSDLSSLAPGFYVSSLQLEKPSVSVESGGTGATAAGTTLLSNIGVTSGTADAPATGTPGTIYIQYI